MLWFRFEVMFMVRDRVRVKFRNKVKVTTAKGWRREDFMEWLTSNSQSTSGIY